MFIEQCLSLFSSRISVLFFDLPIFLLIFKVVIYKLSFPFWFWSTWGAKVFKPSLCSIRYLLLSTGRFFYLFIILLWAPLATIGMFTFTAGSNSKFELSAIDLTVSAQSHTFRLNLSQVCSGLFQQRKLPESILEVCLVVVLVFFSQIRHACSLS